MKTYAQLLAWLGTKQQRKQDQRTTCVRQADNSIVCYLFDTAIAQFRPDGTLSLFSSELLDQNLLKNRFIRYTDFGFRILGRRLRTTRLNWGDLSNYRLYDIQVNFKLSEDGLKYNYVDHLGHIRNRPPAINYVPPVVRKVPITFREALSPFILGAMPDVPTAFPEVITDTIKLQFVNMKEINLTVDGKVAIIYKDGGVPPVVVDRSLLTDPVFKGLFP